MYLEYYGLKTEPFNLTPDPDFLFLSEVHKEALACMQLGVKMRKGFIVLTGEVGTGKTTLIRTFLNNLPSNVNVASVVNTRVTAKNLLQNICKDFGIEADYSRFSKDGLLNLLYEFILQNSFYGKNLAVIIDEAHDLGVNHLEDVRLLTNLETNTQKLLQVVLVGQPELWDLLNMTELRALKQRIHMRFELQPLNFSEMQHYIRHRLTQAGAGKENLFTAQALQKIYKISGGMPRLINIACTNALLIGYSQEQKVVNKEILEEVEKELLPPPSEGERMGKMPEKITESPVVDEPAVDAEEERNGLFLNRYSVWKLVAAFITLHLILTLLGNYLSKIFHLY